MKHTLLVSTAAAALLCASAGIAAPPASTPVEQKSSYFYSSSLQFPVAGPANMNLGQVGHDTIDNAIAKFDTALTDSAGGPLAYDSVALLDRNTGAKIKGGGSALGEFGIGATFTANGGGDFMKAVAHPALEPVYTAPALTGA